MKTGTYTTSISLKPLKTGSLLNTPSNIKTTTKTVIYKCALKCSMVIKSLTITEEAYNSLKRLKYGDESFSEVIIRMSNGKVAPLEKYLGILKDDKELESRIKTRRKLIDFETKERIKRFQKIGV